MNYIRMYFYCLTNFLILFLILKMHREFENIIIKKMVHDYSLFKMKNYNMGELIS